MSEVNSGQVEEEKATWKLIGSDSRLVVIGVLELNAANGFGELVAISEGWKFRIFGYSRLGTGQTKRVCFKH
jgi:hypothetical protein